MMNTTTSTIVVVDSWSEARLGPAQPLPPRLKSIVQEADPIRPGGHSSVTPAGVEAWNQPYHPQKSETYGDEIGVSSPPPSPPPTMCVQNRNVLLKRRHPGSRVRH